MDLDPRSGARAGPLIDVRTEAVLQAALERAVQQTGALGATAAVRCEGLGAWAGAAGFTAPAAGTAMSADACMPAYSITKLATAICAVRLSETGALALDDPVAKWLPDLAFPDAVTLRRLLNHSAGVPNYSLIPEQCEALERDPGHAWSFERFVEASCRRGLDFEPGTGWSYSNTGYMLLKRVVELAHGSGFAEAIEQHVSGPLGFSHTFAVAGSFAGLAAGFSRRFSTTLEDVRPVFDPGWCATGVLASTAAELCEMIGALFGGKLVRSESLAQMTQPVAVPGSHAPAVSPGYGLGLMADPDGRFGPEFGHGGGGPGYDLRVAHFDRLADRRVSIAVMCNTDGDRSDPILRALVAELERQLGITITLS